MTYGTALSATARSSGDTTKAARNGVPRKPSPNGQPKRTGVQSGLLIGGGIGSTSIRKAVAAFDATMPEGITSGQPEYWHFTMNMTGKSPSQ